MKTDANFFKVWGGISGCQSVLQLLLTAAYDKRHLPLPTVASLTSENIARRFGLFPSKGRLALGADADLVFVDLQSRHQLQANNLSATIDANGLLTVSTTNDYASSTLGSAAAGGAIGGTLTSSLTFSTASSPVQDSVAQTSRSNLVSQYNNILNQIDTTSQDSSFNGVNLLNGDQLKLVFDETGKSNLSITGVTYNSKGLGLASLTSGVDFIDNAATNKVLTNLNSVVDFALKHRDDFQQLLSGLATLTKGLAEDRAQITVGRLPPREAETQRAS